MSYRQSCPQGFLYRKKRLFYVDMERSRIKYCTQKCAGKSTVAYAFEHPECLEWQIGVNPADYTILIYNQAFIDRNLANYGDLKGVFTLSEENAETRKRIDDKMEERKGVIADGKQAAEDRDTQRYRYPSLRY